MADLFAEQLTDAEIIGLAFRVRAAQKHYFKARSQEALIASKQLEKQLDDALAARGIDGKVGV